MIKSYWKIVPVSDHPSDNIFEIKKTLKIDGTWLNKWKAELYEDVQKKMPIRYLEPPRHEPFYSINEVFMGMPMSITLARNFMRNENAIRIDCVFEIEDKQCSA